MDADTFATTHLSVHFRLENILLKRKELKAFVDELDSKQKIVKKDVVNASDKFLEWSRCMMASEYHCNRAYEYFTNDSNAESAKHPVLVSESCALAVEEKALLFISQSKDEDVEEIKDIRRGKKVRNAKVVSKGGAEEGWKSRLRSRR